MLDFKYSHAHQHLLEEALVAANSPYALKFIEGFLFADVCGPHAQEPEQWLNALGFNEGALEQDVVFAFMALHHNISEAVFAADGYQLTEHLPLDVALLQQWSQGFLFGATAYVEQLMSTVAQPQVLSEALQVSTEQLGFFAIPHEQIAHYCDVNGLNIDAFFKEQYQLMAEFANQYAALIEASAQVLFHD